MGAHERHNMGKKAKKDKQVEQDDDAWMDQVMPLREELTKLQCIMDDAMAAAVLQHQKSAMPVYRKRNDILASVPGFWAKALGGHPMLHGIISEKDTEILQFCTRLDVDVPEIKPKIEGGESEQIVLTMSFEKNAFFSNTTLRKSVTSIAQSQCRMRMTSLTRLTWSVIVLSGRRVTGLLREVKRTKRGSWRKRDPCLMCLMARNMQTTLCSSP